MSLQATIGMVKYVFFSMPKIRQRIQLLNLTLKSAQNFNNFKKIHHEENTINLSKPKQDFNP